MVGRLGAGLLAVACATACGGHEREPVASGTGEDGTDDGIDPGDDDRAADLTAAVEDMLGHSTPGGPANAKEIADLVAYLRRL